MGPSAVEWTTEEYTYLGEFAMELRPWAISASSLREDLSPEQMLQTLSNMEHARFRLLVDLRLSLEHPG